jgi:ribosomal-protein-alanine N-acetyltransferase
MGRAHARGASALFLEVRPSNVVAGSLYDSLGFNEIGLRKNYYPSHIGHEDARVLAVDLDAYFAGQQP